MAKVYAPDQPFFTEGATKIYDYPPRDTELREELLPFGMKHQAKYNCYMLRDVIEYVSEPGERIMDIMAGTGSSLIAATLNRDVTLIEISTKWKDEFIMNNLNHLKQKFPDNKYIQNVIVLNFPCQDVLPVPTDHIIFSPPYSVIMKKKTISAGDLTDDFYGTSAEEFAEYSNNPGNVGGQNAFMYAQMMEDIYQRAFKSVRPGGTMSVIIKDHIKDGKRVYLSDWVTRVCIRAGWHQKDWIKWNAPGGPFLNIYRKRGWPVVDDEDIMIYVRPE
jgi:hypothetical protein